MLRRLFSLAPWLTGTGIAATLVGLGWDAVLHRLDSGLAEREGVFTLANPGHVILAGGIAMVAAGVALSLAEQAARPGSRRALALAAAAGIVALGGASFALAGGSGTTFGGGHSHPHGGAEQPPASGDPVDAHEHTAAEAAAIVASASSKLPGVTHDHGEAVAITAAELQSAAALVSAVQTGTTRLQDFAVAKAEGYFQITAGRSGLVHFHHQGYFTDGRTLDAGRPEEIMYLRMPGGAMKLVGVMFLMPPGEPGPRIAGPLTAWHAHDNLCYNVSTGIVEALTGADGTCPAGTVFRGVTPEMMHVWLVNNPEGVFSEDMDPATLSQVLAARP